MNVLVTGATGYIGGAVAQAVHDGGHRVFALAHSEEVAAHIRERGWSPVPGDLREAEGLRRAARECDAVIHAGNTGGEDAAMVDRSATLALLSAVEGRQSPFIYTSGAWVLGPGTSDEDSRANPVALVEWRASLEADVLRSAAAVRSVVIRPGIVYGRGGGIPGMVARGEVPVIGDGRQRWPLVHITDLAQLYVRALTAPAGSVLHGVSTTASMRDLALLGAVTRGGKIRSMSLADAQAAHGAFADALALDQEVSSMRTRQLVVWTPSAPSPVEEFLAGSYAQRPAELVA